MCVIASGLGDLKATQEACMTYEGENWVLIQQVANFLIKIWENIRVGVEVTFPLKSVDFLNNAEEILKRGKFSPKTKEELYQPERKI